MRWFEPYGSIWIGSWTPIPYVLLKSKSRSCSVWIYPSTGHFPHSFRDLTWKFRWIIDQSPMTFPFFITFHHCSIIFPFFIIVPSFFHHFSIVVHPFSIIKIRCFWSAQCMVLPRDSWSSANQRTKRSQLPHHWRGCSGTCLGWRSIPLTKTGATSLADVSGLFLGKIPLVCL